MNSRITHRKKKQQNDDDNLPSENTFPSFKIFSVNFVCRVCVRAQLLSVRAILW